MTPVFICLFFLSLSALPGHAVDDEVMKEVSSDVSLTISRVNSHATTRLIHGDLLPNTNKNADPCTATGCKWPKTGNFVYVPVTISSQYTREEQNIIIRALLTFHQSTCIRFMWRRRERNYIYFYSGSGCFSYLGRQNRGQPISLSQRGCLYLDTVQHEVLHALGFHHEQVRSDRDEHVSILTQNIQPGTESNFEKEQTNNLETPYDFDSVMHYSNYAFSRNGQPTIIAKDDPKRLFGQATKMSQNDIDRVNKLYNCCE
ncbi:high choriolytic enzyme 2-like isoform X1 [Labrus bergylta]|uniref:high choriolytic enzyme 2-like isoform X1 n=2 Tax=Labrus bergylta TaxID=56723 RepID=UPI0010FADEE9|nr:high choriolytic enzyme 2-like [Labrus bergylta]